MNNFSEATLQALALSETQGDLFRDSSGQTASPMEGEFAAGCRSAGSPIRAAFESSLANEVDSYVREMRATLVAEGGIKEIADVVRAVADAFDSAIPDVASAFCGGGSPEHAPDLSLDEDLLPPSRKAGP